MVLTSSIAFAITNVKKMKEIYKEKKIHQKITVNLSKQQPHEVQLKFNNVKNNFPLLSGYQTALLVGFVLVGNLTFWCLEYTFNDAKYFYKQFLYKELTIIFIYNILAPLVYLIKKKKMRKYFWEYVSDVMF